MLSTPVLFLVFNRPDTTRRVFEQIRAAKPRQLFIGADGPRAEREGELEKCEEVRGIVTNVDWECEVKTLFRDSNLGCGAAPREAITWFFQQVEEGIILEDDTLPDFSFFFFCEQQLGLHRGNKQVGIISGNNFLSDVWPVSRSGRYFFSAYAFTWGWATTRETWQEMDYSLRSLDRDLLEKNLRYFFKSPEIIRHWMRLFEIYVEHQYNIWDYRFFFNQIYRRKLHVIPHVNLVKNIGFGEGASNTTSENHLLARLRVQQIKFENLPHRPGIQNREYDEFASEYIYGVFIQRTVIHRLIRKILRQSGRVYSLLGKGITN